MKPNIVPYDSRLMFHIYSSSYGQPFSDADWGIRDVNSHVLPTYTRSDEFSARANFQRSAREHIVLVQKSSELEYGLGARDIYHLWRRLSRREADDI